MSLDDNIETKKYKSLKIAKDHAIKAIDYEVKQEWNKAKKHYLLAKKNLEDFIEERESTSNTLHLALSNYKNKIKQMNSKINQKK